MNRLCTSRNSSIKKVTNYNLDDQGSAVKRGRSFLCHRIQTGTVVHPVSKSVDNGGSSPRLKLKPHNHTVPKFKSMLSFTSIPLTYPHVLLALSYEVVQLVCCPISLHAHLQVGHSEKGQQCEGYQV
jgi:hypothetical protein